MRKMDDCGCGSVKRLPVAEPRAQLTRMSESESVAVHSTTTSSPSLTETGPDGDIVTLGKPKKNRIKFFTTFFPKFFVSDILIKKHKQKEFIFHFHFIFNWNFTLTSQIEVFESFCIFYLLITNSNSLCPNNILIFKVSIYFNF